MELNRKQLVENFYKPQKLYFILQCSHLLPPLPMLPALSQTATLLTVTPSIAHESNRRVEFFQVFFFFNELENLPNLSFSWSQEN